MSNIVMCDSKGIMTKNRLKDGDLNEFKAPFAVDSEGGSLADALVGADVFLGLSEEDWSLEKWLQKWQTSQLFSL